jgi:hypothetical protein
MTTKASTEFRGRNIVANIKSQLLVLEQNDDRTLSRPMPVRQVPLAHERLEKALLYASCQKGNFELQHIRRKFTTLIRGWAGGGRGGGIQ